MQPLTRDDFVNVLRRTTDAGWLNALLEDPDSRAVLQGLADVWARISVATARSCNNVLISSAPGGRPGAAVVTLTRPTGLTAGVIPRAFSFQTPEGFVLVTTQDVPVAIGQLTVLLPLQTLRRTEGVNTEDDAILAARPTAAIADASNATPIIVSTHQPHTYATGDIVVIDGVVGNTAANGTWTITVLTPSTFSLTGSIGIAPYGGAGRVQPAPLGLVVASATPISDGASDYLSAHGQERSVQRTTGELEEHYRGRVRDIPDMVSPRAIGLAVQGIVQQERLPTTVVQEPFEDGATPALKANLGLGTFPAFACDADACDDPSIVTVSSREARAYFKVDVQGIPKPGDDTVFFCDDGFCDDPYFGYLDVPADPRALAGLLALWEEANRKRAGGVQFDVEVDVYQVELGSGDSLAAGEVIVWGLAAAAPPQPSPGKIWHFIDGFFSHIRVPGSSMPAGAYHKVRFDYEDGSSVETAAWTRLDSERLHFSDLAALGPAGGRITGVSGILRSDGAQTLRMLGAFRVLEVSL